MTLLVGMPLVMVSGWEVRGVAMAIHNLVGKASSSWVMILLLKPPLKGLISAAASGAQWLVPWVLKL